MDITTKRSRRRLQRPTKHVVRTVTVLIASGVIAATCSHSPKGPSVPNASSSSPSSPGSPLALAQCMRDHGIHDFPDPDSSGNFDLGGGSDLNPNNPSYQAAARGCRSLGSAGKASSGSLSPLQIAAVVRFAGCMRSHGIDNYPDPDSSGRIPGIRHFGIESSSPQFQAANNACRHYVSSLPVEEAP